MATRVELHKDAVKTALEQSLASAKRQLNTAKNPAFRPIIEKDIADLNNAINTLAEIK